MSRYQKKTFIYSTLLVPRTQSQSVSQSVFYCNCVNLACIAAIPNKQFDLYQHTSEDLIRKNFDVVRRQRLL